MIILPCYFKLFTPYWAEKMYALFECDIYLKHFFLSSYEISIWSAITADI